MHDRSFIVPCLVVMMLASSVAQRQSIEKLPTGGAVTCTTTAADASRTAVANAITAARSGATICVPPGSATWTSAITLPSGKDLTIAGHGGAEAIVCAGAPGTSGYTCGPTANQTILTCNQAPGCFVLDLARNHRITGFTMTTNANEVVSCSGAQAAGSHFRVDHNRFISTAGWQPIRCKNNGGTSNLHPQGIWDHNKFENVAIHTNGTLCTFNDTGCNIAHDIWSREPILGDSSEVVYLESNHFFSDTAGFFPNFTDGNNGMRVVIRFNHTQGSSAAAFEIHSAQGQNRGSQRWEIYRNAIVDPDRLDLCFFGLASVRGGTGVIFDNAMSGQLSGCNLDIRLDNVRSRSDYSGGTPPGRCDGKSAWDQNTGGQSGWRCRDQLGMSHDLSRWNHTTTPTWNQNAKPAYLWNNTRADNQVTYTIESSGLNGTHIVANREVYFHSTAAGSSQTVGVRRGTRATMTAITTCTQNVGFWVIDEGEWDGTNGATPDGRLYKCGASNNWTPYYTPYPYPHRWAN